MGGGVRGVLLDSSALLAEDNGGGNNGSEIENENEILKPGADYLLRKLRYSNIPVGITYELGLSTSKVKFLEKISKQCSFDIFVMNSSLVEVTANEVARAWGDSGGSILHVACTVNEEHFVKLRNFGWLIVIPRSLGEELRDGAGGDASKEPSMSFINKLEELPLTICNLNRKAAGNGCVLVGYVMKPSREEDFAKRGAFPLRPTANGLIFVPLTFDLPISTQLQQIDVVIHKATDEIISIKLGSSSERSNNITYSKGMLELQRCLGKRTDFCVIDPFDNISPVLDRFKIHQLLLGLETLNAEARCKIRAPHCLKVNNFGEPELRERLLEAALSPPSIVKPQVACGVADAHSMIYTNSHNVINLHYLTEDEIESTLKAIVFKVDDYRCLNVPLPAVVQEYVDHSSSLFKFYVLGEKIFYALKKSTPNADILIKLSEKDGLKPLLFDSLKSLPTAQKEQQSGDTSIQEASKHQMDLELVTDAAKWLSKKLNLTIFGFDVVIQDGTGDHVIVDVNYLPSFKEVPDDEAIPAFWGAIKRKYEAEQHTDQK